MTDFYLLATGMNPPHIKALVEAVEKEVKSRGGRRFRKAGAPDSEWVVLDFVDVVVHIFSPDARGYYALEQIDG